jgi:cyclopropane fatty-acyl-phospholipid synthase-like methyltransferase
VPTILGTASRLAVKASNLAWELWLGIATHGVEGREWQSEERHPYETSPYLLIHAILAHLQLGPSDVFVDVGCGKGRVVCCAARRPLRKVIGIDQSAGLIDAARVNAAALRGRRSELILARVLAEDYDFSEATVVYMNNPLGPKSLGAMLARVEAARACTGQPVRFAYNNPVHEAILRDCGWLVRTDHWRAGRVFGQRNPVSFWGSSA